MGVLSLVGSAWIYLIVNKRLVVLHRDVRMKKLLLATVCVIALTVGAQAKPVHLAFIDDRWAIEYDSELFAGACIATIGYNLLKLKVSFITAYPKEGTEKLWFIGFSSGLGLRVAQLMILPLIPKGKAVKQKIDPCFYWRVKWVYVCKSKC
jgi:hypothetical protein